MDLTHPLNCLTFNVQRAARDLSRRFERAIRQSGLTAPQFSTLAVLRMRGEMNVSDIAEHIGADRTTLTRNLDRIERLGWIEAAEAKDQRLHVFRLTDAGRSRLADAMPDWAAFQAELVGNLGDQAAADLLRTLKTM